MSKKFVYDGRKDMTKKAYKELQKRNRVVVNMNTGTITMKTAKILPAKKIKEI